MNRAAPFKQIPPASGSVELLTRFSRWVAWALAVVCWFLVVGTQLALWKLPGKPGWPEAVLVLAVTAVTLLAQARDLPGQNVFLAAAIIGLIGGVIHALGVLTALPFGPLVYTDNSGPRLFGVLPWPIPMLWIIVILSSRGVARLILRPWRKLRNYGFLLIGLTAGLTVVFDAALEPFATRAGHYWLWSSTRFPISWHGAPVVNFLGWLMTALLILAFVTPTLINKSPHPRSSPPDYHPLCVWLGALAIFAIGTAAQSLWSATAFCVISGVAVGCFAIRGARW